MAGENNDVNESSCRLNVKIKDANRLEWVELTFFKPIFSEPIREQFEPLANRMTRNAHEQCSVVREVEAYMFSAKQTQMITPRAYDAMQS